LETSPGLYLSLLGGQVRTILETEVGKEFTYPCTIDPARAVAGYPVCPQP